MNKWITLLLLSSNLILITIRASGQEIKMDFFVDISNPEELFEFLSGDTLSTISAVPSLHYNVKVAMRNYRSALKIHFSVGSTIAADDIASVSYSIPDDTFSRSGVTMKNHGGESLFHIGEYFLPPQYFIRVQFEKNDGSLGRPYIFDSYRDLIKGTL